MEDKLELRDIAGYLPYGLMENYKKFSNEIYSVTEKGIEAVKTLLLIKK